MPFAIFFDMLGTSDAMTSLPDDHVFNDDTHIVLNRSQFQESLRLTASMLGKQLIFCASFSDCGYLIIESPMEVLHAVRRAMYFFYVPVRGGIGFGNFGLGGTTHTWNGHTAISESNFFGSALVRAHRAESCGLKGLRTFVHESAAPALGAAFVNSYPGVAVFPEDTADTDDEYLPPVSVPGAPLDVPLSPYPDVKTEICYIGDEIIDRWYRRIDMLERAFPPGPEAAIHYKESRNALARFESLRRD
jgi:hypothetical protein